jgi:uncharacterized protein involved in type VI secretion and phage assembly
MTGKFIGKYRGKVSDNKDPLMTGRIKAKVTDVTGLEETGWAMPCAPYTGFFALPKNGSGVWIEFEQGDLNRPIWSGCWWGSVADVPPIVLAPPYEKVLLQTEGGNKIILDDTPGIGGITLETSGGQKVTLSPLSIEITNSAGSIKIEGPKVSINGIALVVT